MKSFHLGGCASFALGLYLAATAGAQSVLDSQTTLNSTWAGYGQPTPAISAPISRTAYWDNKKKEDHNNANHGAGDNSQNNGNNGFEPLPTPPMGGHNGGAANTGVGAGVHGGVGQGYNGGVQGGVGAGYNGGVGVGQGYNGGVGVGRGYNGGVGAGYNSGVGVGQGYPGAGYQGGVQGSVLTGPIGAGAPVPAGAAIGGNVVGGNVAGGTIVGGNVAGPVNGGYVVNQGEYIVEGGGAACGGAPAGGYLGFGSGGSAVGTGFIAAGGGRGVGPRGGACSFGGVNGLIFTRDREDDVWLSFDTTNVAGHLLSYREAEMPYSAGVEATYGRRIRQGYAWEARYFGIYPGQVEANALDPSGVPAAGADLNTTLDLTPLNYNDGAGASSVNDWFDNAARHRLRRSWRIHNAEINLLHSPACCGGFGVPGLGANNVSIIGGFRYLHFGEDFSFGTDETDTTFTGAADELFYDISTRNNLYGFQLGADGRFALTQRLDVVTIAKFGVYANDISHTSRIYGANGNAVVGAGPNAGRAFAINSRKTDVSFLGELDLGLAYRVGCRWSLRGGYRAIAISGIALPAGQIPRNFADIDGVANIDSGASTILHGAYAGAEYRW